MEAVTEFFARLSQACYVICKNGSCYDEAVISYLANTNNQVKEPSYALCPPTVDMFKSWQKGTGYFELGVAKFKCMMGGRGMEWAQRLLERVFQHTTEYSVADEGSLNHLQYQFEERRQLMECLKCQGGNILMEQQIYPYLAQEHQNSPPFVLAIQAGAQGSEGTDSGQDVESASCFFEKLSSDKDEVRRKSINARTLWLYKQIKLYLGVHSMRKVSEDLNLWHTFTRGNDSEDEDSSSDLHDEVYASDSAEFRLDVLFDSQGQVDIYDASQVMSSD